MKKYKRNCPNCNIELLSTNNNYIKYSEKIKRLCATCAKKGKNNPMFGNHCNIGQIPPNKGKKMNKKDIEKRRKYFKYCPECNNKMKYTTKKGLHYSIKINRLCYSCCKKGKRNVNYNRKFSKKTLKKMSDNHADVSGKNNPMYGKTHSSITRKILRIKNIEWIEKNNNGLPIFPFFNPVACQIIDDYGKKNGYNFQHAMNGGEYYIKELGYWIDGYDRKNNIVIEYYESYHATYKQIERDKQRIKEIKEFLNCKIIILREWTDKTEIL